MICTSYFCILINKALFAKIPHLGLIRNIIFPKNKKKSTLENGIDKLSPLLKTETFFQQQDLAFKPRISSLIFM